MATDKLGASILESRLSSIKKEFESVKTLLDSLNDSAGTFGSTLSQSIRTAKGELHGLEAALKGLETTLKRTSTTGSTVGAANISASLGQLTGQGRTHSGGYGGGGGGGYGGGGGRIGQGLFGAAGDMSTSLGDALGRVPLLGGPLRFAFGGLGALAKAQGGMAWGGMKGAQGVRRQWEQAARYTRGLGPGFAGSKKGFAGLSELGISPFEGADTLGMLQSQLGYSRPSGSQDIRNIGALGHATGITPGEHMSTWAMARAGGMGLPQSFELSNKLWGQARGMARGSLGLTRPGPLPAGANDEAVRKHAQAMRRYEEAVFPRSQYNLRQMTPGVQGLIGQQIAGAGGINAAQQEQMQNLIASMARPGGGFGNQPGVAAQMANALGVTAAAPGGGEAGQLLMMRAAGFGNPMLKEYRKVAEKMGIDPSKFQRRNFLESKMFLEEDPVRRLQAMMVGIGAEYGPQRGPGYKEAQTIALAEMGAPQGITHILAKKLIDQAHNKNLGEDSIKNVIREFGGLDAQREILGQIKPDVSDKKGLLLTQDAQLAEASIGLGDAVTSFGAAVNKFDIAALKQITTAMNKLVPILNRISVSDEAMKTFFKPLDEFVEQMAKLLE